MPQRSDTARRGELAWSALAGVVAAAVFLAVAEVLALAVGPGASPIVAVGAFVVDVVPRPLKEFAIAAFGAFDKPALLIGLGIAVVIAAALAGILQLVRRPAGALVVVAAGAAATAAVVTRSGAGALAWLPTAAGIVAGVLTLALLIAKLRASGAPPVGEPTAVENPAAPRAEGRLDRRSFVRAAAVTGLAAALVGLGARALGTASSSIAAIRDELRLPEPRRRVSLPAGAELDVAGITPLLTPNADFYRVDTALVVPAVDPASWRLVIDGRVDQRIELGFDDLLAMGVEEYPVTLTCVSNEVGGDLVGTAIWLGVPVRDLLRRARPHADADMVLSRSVDGFTASTPLAALTDETLDAILAVGMNDEPLPLEHGFPVRMVVPGLYGYVSATKWLTNLHVTTFADDEAYWTPRGYSAQAPIKMSARIDTPRAGAPIAAGTTVLAGVAWAQPVGVARVEVSIDDAPWQTATLSTPISSDTWVQWMLPWKATTGAHYVTVRAVDREGVVQTQERTPIAPDGATGWHRLLVNVG